MHRNGFALVLAWPLAWACTPTTRDFNDVEITSDNAGSSSTGGSLASQAGRSGITTGATAGTNPTSTALAGNSSLGGASASGGTSSTASAGGSSLGGASASSGGSGAFGTGGSSPDSSSTTGGDSSTGGSSADSSSTTGGDSSTVSTGGSSPDGSSTTGGSGTSGGTPSLGGTSSDLGTGGTSVGGSLPVGTTETGGVTVGTGGTLASGGTSGTGGASTGKPYGATCTVSAECAGLICVDRVCCSSACNGSCQVCDATGTCQSVVMSEDDSCKTDVTGTRMCDAQGQCSVPHLLRDVNPISYTLNGVTNTNPSTPRYFTEGPDRRVYFSASDGTAGEELWATDGTAAGTLLVADILAGSSNSSPRGLINAGVNLYFSAVDSVGYPRLYATNGTAAGTLLVKDLGTNAFPSNSLSALSAGNMIYFTACNASAGCELWRSGGTDAGTFMVADIMNTTVTTTSTQTFGSNPSELALMDNIVYFRAASAIVGLGTTNVVADYELWRSDGIAANTVRVADIEPGLGNGMPTYLTPMQTLNGSVLLFAASRGASNQELYFTNGTVGSFSSVDIYPGATGSYPGPFVPMGNRVYFQATDPINGGELWVTDGTPAGTHLVKDVYVGSGSSAPSLLKAAGNYLYFRANNGTGYALWRTDGTDAGTSKVFSAFTPAGTTLFQIQGFGNHAFMCTAGSGTQELWVTDGTTAGTYVTCPDKSKPCGTPFPSNPSDMTSIGGRLYFNATALPSGGGSLGAEPYVYP